jgi:hypothetical protein
MSWINYCISLGLWASALKNVKIYFLRSCSLFFLLAVVFLIISCTPELSDDPVPIVPFSPINVNLNLPEYQALNTTGFVYINGGVRGIILHRLTSSSYVAYERNCTYQPNEACATVEMHSSNLYLFDPCCNSTFELSTGNPSGGPAWRPLRQYETILSGTELTITDEIIN